MEQKLNIVIVLLGVITVLMIVNMFAYRLEGQTSDAMMSRGSGWNSLGGFDSGADGGTYQ